MAVYCSKTKWLVAGGGGSQDFCHFATTMSQVCARAPCSMCRLQLVQLVQTALQFVQLLYISKCCVGTASLAAGKYNQLCLIVKHTLK